MSPSKTRLPSKGSGRTPGVTITFAGIALLATGVTLGPGGCGGSTHPNDAAPATHDLDGFYRSGSRLRADVWEGGGATVFDHWHDTKLGIDCTFRPAADGTWVCLPGATQPLDQPQYSDAGCTKRILVNPTAPLPFAAQNPSCDGPSTEPVAYAVASQPLAQPTYYARQGSSCVPTNVPDGEMLWPLTPLDPAPYVHAHATREHRGAGLDVEILTADDGTEQLGRAFDVARDAPCVPGDYHRCLPLNAGQEGTAFVTADCSQSAAGVWECFEDLCTQPSWALRLTTSACNAMCGCPTPDLAGVVPVGDSVPMTWEGPPGGACAATPIGPACKYHATTGPMIPADQFPSTITSHTGTTLASIASVTANDPRPLNEATGTFWDFGRSATCRPTAFADGKHRCLPDGVENGSPSLRYYADSNCSQPLISSSACTPPKAAVSYEAAPGVFVDPVQAVFAVGSAYRGPLYFLNSGRCYSTTVPGTYYQLGAQIDPSSVFVEVTERVE